MNANTIIAITSIVIGSTLALTAQAPPRDSRSAEVARVRSLDEILPRSDVERNLARYLDRPGEPLRPGLNQGPPFGPPPPQADAPPGYKAPAGDDLLAISLCFPGNRMAFATVLDSRVVATQSRSELITIYRLRVVEWIPGNHEAEIFIGIRGGRVFIAGEDYATPIGLGPRASLYVGTSYVLPLLPVGPGAYLLSRDPIAEAEGRITLAGRADSTADALSRLRRVSERCGKPRDSENRK
jgi:hypothetical protein